MHAGLAVGRDVHVAVADSVAEQEALVAHRRGQPLNGWLVPDSLLDAVAAAGVGPGAARSRAAPLARLPSVAASRPMLRRIAAPDPRQLTLVS